MLAGVCFNSNTFATSAALEEVHAIGFHPTGCYSSSDFFKVEIILYGWL